MQSNIRNYILKIMPAKNSLKIYLKDGYYHIYNRGVEKRQIFQDHQDYGVFLSYLKEYLTPKDENALLTKLDDSTISSKEKDKILKALRMNNFSGEITLIAYCLMPNHFHFLIKQHNEQGIDRFMSSLGTRYTMYFNKKYKRVGSLYQGVYKAVPVTTDEQLLYLTRYIHRNPLKLSPQGLSLQDQLTIQPSSYFEFIMQRNTHWIYPNIVLSYFSKVNRNLSYQNFVTQNEDTSTIQDLFLDEDQN